MAKPIPVFTLAFAAYFATSQRQSYKPLASDLGRGPSLLLRDPNLEKVVSNPETPQTLQPTVDEDRREVPPATEPT